MAAVNATAMTLVTGSGKVIVRSTVSAAEVNIALSATAERNVQPHVEDESCEGRIELFLTHLDWLDLDRLVDDSLTVPSIEMDDTGGRAPRRKQQ